MAGVYAAVWVNTAVRSIVLKAFVTSTWATTQSAVALVGSAEMVSCRPCAMLSHADGIPTPH